MPNIQLGETSFYYDCQGKGTPLVLIAGYSCDSQFWHAMFEKLTPHFTVLIFDNRGIGQTHDDTTPLSIELMAKDTMQLVKALGLEKPIILGHSMGGLIAQTIARNHQPEIAKLIIANSSVKLNPRALMVLASLLEIYHTNISADTLIEASMTWFYSPDYLTPKNIAAYKEMCVSNPFPPSFELLARQLKALAIFDSSNWINTLTTQTLVIASEDDIVCLPKESQNLAKQITGAQYKLIKGGHSTPIECPLAVVEAILAFTK